MSKVVLLDSSPLGLVTNPRMTDTALLCNEWLEALLVANVRVIIPEIADYEIRRELLRANKTRGIQRLDLLKQELEYLPLTTEAMLKAAELWAKARQQGQPTAHDKAIDGDVILAAQALTLDADSSNVVIATSNLKHLSRFTLAQLWQAITP
jgi:predicted nucleic acid-binding protein